MKKSAYRRRKTLESARKTKHLRKLGAADGLYVDGCYITGHLAYRYLREEGGRLPVAGLPNNGQYAADPRYYWIRRPKLGYWILSDAARVCAGQHTHPERPQCAYVRKNGLQCLRHAVENSPFCARHDQVHNTSSRRAEASADPRAQAARRARFLARKEAIESAPEALKARPSWRRLSSSTPPHRPALARLVGYWFQEAAQGRVHRFVELEQQVLEWHEKWRAGVERRLERDRQRLARGEWQPPTHKFRGAQTEPPVLV